MKSQKLVPAKSSQSQNRKKIVLANNSNNKVAARYPEKGHVPHTGWASANLQSVPEFLRSVPETMSCSTASVSGEASSSVWVKRIFPLYRQRESRYVCIEIDHCLLGVGSAGSFVFIFCGTFWERLDDEVNEQWRNFFVAEKNTHPQKRQSHNAPAEVVFPRRFGKVPLVFIKWVQRSYSIQCLLWEYEEC